ncbi:metallopeptidase family protein [Nocardioides salsibiostraticola]
MPVDVTRERFEELVESALDGIPDQLASLVQNLVVLVEETPPDGEPRDLLGLYDGYALTERDSFMAAALPDRIFVFRQPLQQMCRDEAHLVEEVRITVVHEVAHHFGIEEARLHELGYG